MANIYSWIILVILIFVIFIGWILQEIKEVLDLIHQRLTWVHEDLKEKLK